MGPEIKSSIFNFEKIIHEGTIYSKETNICKTNIQCLFHFVKLLFNFFCFFFHSLLILLLYQRSQKLFKIDMNFIPPKSLWFLCYWKCARRAGKKPNPSNVLCYIKIVKPINMLANIDVLFIMYKIKQSSPFLISIKDAKKTYELIRIIAISRIVIILFTSFIYYCFY